MKLDWDFPTTKKYLDEYESYWISVVPIFVTPFGSTCRLDIEWFCPPHAVDEWHVTIVLCKGIQAEIPLQEMVGRLARETGLYVVFAIVLRLNGSLFTDLQNPNDAWSMIQSE